MAWVAVAVWSAVGGGSADAVLSGDGVSSADGFAWTVPVPDGVGDCAVSLAMGDEDARGVTVHGGPVGLGVGVSKLPSIGYPWAYHDRMPPSSTSTCAKPDL